MPVLRVLCIAFLVLCMTSTAGLSVSEAGETEASVEGTSG